MTGGFGLKISEYFGSRLICVVATSVYWRRLSPRVIHAADTDLRKKTKNILYHCNNAID